MECRSENAAVFFAPTPDDSLHNINPLANGVHGTLIAAFAHPLVLRAEEMFSLVGDA
jgi:hypothetical protein